MRIAVNLLPFRKYLAGVGRYAKRVLQNLAEIDMENSYHLFVTGQAVQHFEINRNNFNLVVCPFSSEKMPIRILWEQIVLPLQLIRYRSDVLFTPSVVIPLWVPCRTVTAIHDMAPFHDDISKYPKVRTSYIRFMTLKAAKKANLVLTVSNNSRWEIAKFCGIPEDRIVVAHNGVDARYTKVNSKEAIAECRSKYSLPDKFILFVGTLEPGKNLVRLMKAFQQLKGRAKHIEHKLVLVGIQGWGMSSILQVIEESGLTDEVTITGFVPEQDLPLIYNAAALFVFPSLYEGFGLPPLEAMACGVPVVASNVSSLPEVIGDAGLLVDPYSTEELAAAMERVLTDKRLRAQMIHRGTQRAKQFSWTMSARIILGALERVGSGL